MRLATGTRTGRCHYRGFLSTFQLIILPDCTNTSTDFAASPIVAGGWLFCASRLAKAGCQWWRVEAAVEAFLGHWGTGGAGRPLGVGDRDRGEQPADGARRAGDERRGAEPGGERVWVQVGGAGDARQCGQDGDSQQAAKAGHVVVDRRGDAR